MDRAYAFRNGWRWIGWYLRRGRLLPAARQVWLAYVIGWISEVCQDCGRRYPLWRADDKLYSRVTGRVGRNGERAGGLFCHDCFDTQAEKRGITLQWVPKEYVRP